MNAALQTAKGYAPDLTLRVGDIITFPTHQLRVVATEFKRNAFFPDAVAQVAIERGNETVGTHVSTPYGMVEITLDERPIGFDDGFEDDDFITDRDLPVYADAD